MFKRVLLVVLIVSLVCADEKDYTADVKKLKDTI